MAIKQTTNYIAECDAGCGRKNTAAGGEMDDVKNFLRQKGWKVDERNDKCVCEKCSKDAAVVERILDAGKKEHKEETPAHAHAAGHVVKEGATEVHRSHGEAHKHRK